MLKVKPFIHLFATACGHYLFDVNKNSILKIPKNVYEALLYEQANGTGSYPCNGEEADYIGRIRKEGFLSAKRPKEIIHPADSTLELHLDRYVEKITLQITQMCNLRCRYCPYSGYSDGKSRTHSGKVMSFETAKKGIDFLIRHSGDVPSINVGFYGGEPLLEFELIKKCIHYARERAEGKNISFSMTTNATLLNEEIVGFLEECDLRLMISFDGPKELHDKNRRFSSNGCGSFDIIMKNMEKIKVKFPEYFKKISFHAVIDTENDLSCTNEFFTNYELLTGADISTTYIDDRFAGEKNIITEDFIIYHNYEMFKLYLNLMDRLDNAYVTPVIRDEYLSSAKRIKYLKPSDSLYDKMHHSGPCIPGCMKLLMDVDGRFFPCERVSETSEVMRIGDVDSGFDIEKIRQLLNIGKLTEEECKDCWSIRYCTLCATAADNMKNLSPELKKTYCDSVRNDTEELFKNHTTLKEFNRKYNQKITG